MVAEPASETFRRWHGMSHGANFDRFNRSDVQLNPKANFSSYRQSPEREYQGCPPAHIAAGFTTAPDGKRMSINIEIIGGSLMVQHYVETLGRKDHLILDSVSDVFTPTGRTTIHVTWELSVREIGGGECEFTNRVRSYATEEFLIFLARQGIPFDQFRAQRQPASIAQNQSENLFSQPALSGQRSRTDWQ